MVAILKYGAEFLVNTATLSNQRNPRIAPLASGGYVVTWEDWSETGGDTSFAAVRAQIYAATGAKVGSEFLVNTETFDRQNFPDVAALTNGGFVIAWQDGSESADDASDRAIRAQVFSATGAKVGAEFLVNTTVLNNQNTPQIATLNDGTFFIAWEDQSLTGADTDSTAVRAQHFAANGAKIGGEFLVNAGVTDGGQIFPRIDALAGGGFVATWWDFVAGNDTISFARFDANGNPDGGPVTILGADELTDPSVAGLANGGFVIAYADDSADVKAEIYSPLGAFITSVTLNTTVTGAQFQPLLAALPDGGFVAAWIDNSASPDDDSGNAARAAAFDAFGNKLQTFAIGGNYTTEFLATTTTSFSQVATDIAVLPNGDFVVTFEDGSLTGGDGDQTAVRAQRFAAYQERVGSDADSLLLGSAGRDFMLGLEGADVVKGNAGDDILDGGLGSDSLDGGPGTDAASYDTAAAAGLIVDLATPGNNTNAAFGDIYTAIENLIGSPDGDNLRGNKSVNMIDGGLGDDTLIGRGGADVLIGAQGNDTASYIFASAGVIADLTTRAVQTGEAKGDTFIAVENLTGSNFKDTLFGDARNNTLMGLDGNDVLEGGDTGDKLDGGLGVNTASYSRAASGVTADLVTPAANQGDAFGDTYASIQNLTGSTFLDALLGDSNVNALSGGSGDDTLEGRGSGDKLDGGTGNDTASYASSALGLRADLTAPATNTNDAAGDTFVSIENLIGTDEVDFLRGNGAANVLIGGKGGDTLDGVGGNDTASYENVTDADQSVTVDLGNPANNTNDAKDDTLISMENLTGTNSTTGAITGDKLIGDSKNNMLSGLNGNDVLTGRNGNDNLLGGDGNDDLDGGDGNDAMDGGNGNDVLTGGIGNDKMTGGDGNDTLNGGDGNDVLDGGTNDDTITGGIGNDKLTGGSGNDTLTGNAGKDTFVYDSPLDGTDTIADLVPVDDTLRFDASNFGGGLAAGALPANRLVANAAPVATKAFGQFLYDTDSGELSFDADGTGGDGAVLLATLTGAPVLTAADFQLVA